MTKGIDPIELKSILSFFGKYSLGKGVFSGPGEQLNCEDQLRIGRLFMSFRRNSVAPIKYYFSKVTGIFALFFGEMQNAEELVDMASCSEMRGVPETYSELCEALYLKFGIEFIQKIKGVFSVVLLDRSRDLFLIAVDRFGLARSVYYYTWNQEIYFSSHLKNFLSNKNMNTEIDQTSLLLFLKYGYIPSPYTILEGISKLNPGEIIIVKRGSLTVKRYIDFETKYMGMSADVLERYKVLLTDSMAKILDFTDKDNIGIFLSGGLDSSCNVAIAHKLEKSFETYTVGFGEKSIDERPYARLVAEFFNVPLKEYEIDGSEIEDLPSLIWYLEEPFLENGIFLTLAAFKLASQNSNILITGDCLDQLFGTGGFADARPIALRYLIDSMAMRTLMEKFCGMTRHSFFEHSDLFYKLKMLLLRAVSFNNWFYWGFSTEELKKLCNFRFSDTKLRVFDDQVTAKNFDEYYQFSVIHQDIEHYACQNLLVKTFRTAEMFKVKVKNPFLNYDVVDFVLSLDRGMKRRGSLLDFLLGSSRSKYIHRKAMENMLPQKILRKPKQGGFVRMACMIREHKLRRAILNYLSSSPSINFYFNYSYIESLFKEYEYFINRKNRWSNFIDSKANRILYLLTFALWFDIFVENPNKGLQENSLSKILL